MLDNLYLCLVSYDDFSNPIECDADWYERIPLVDYNAYIREDEFGLNLAIEFDQHAFDSKDNPIDGVSGFAVSDGPDGPLLANCQFKYILEEEDGYYGLTISTKGEKFHNENA